MTDENVVGPSSAASASTDEPTVESPLVPPVHRPSPKILAIGLGAVLLAGAVIAAVVVGAQPTALEQAAVDCGGLNPYYAVFEKEGSPAPSRDPNDLDVIGPYFEGVVTVEDEGKTLIIQTKPQDEDPLGISSLALDCVYDAIGVPKRVSELIGVTRSLDGRQSGGWEDFSASWSYHPDNGLNLIVVQG